MNPNGLDKHPFMTAVVELEDGSHLAYAVKPILLKNDCQPYALVSADGNIISRTAKSEIDRHVSLVMYDGLYIQNGLVHTLNILLKEKYLYVGKLISLTPGISPEAKEILDAIKAN